MHYYFYFFPGQNCTPVQLLGSLAAARRLELQLATYLVASCAEQPIAMKEITVAMQNKTKVDIRMSSNPLLEVLRTQFLLNCNTFIFRTIEYYRVEK